jgi:hypothetical protein
MHTKLPLVLLQMRQIDKPKTFARVAAFPSIDKRKTRAPHYFEFGRIPLAEQMKVVGTQKHGGFFHKTDLTTF